MKVKGKATTDGRYRGTTVDGKTVYWAKDEQEVDLSPEGYWAVKDDPSVVIVDLEAPPPRPPTQGPSASGQAASQGGTVDVNALAQSLAQALAPHLGGGAQAGGLSPQAAAALAGSQPLAQPGDPRADKGGTATVTTPDNGGTGPSVATAGSKELTANPKAK